MFKAKVVTLLKILLNINLATNASYQRGTGKAVRGLGNLERPHRALH